MKEGDGQEGVETQGASGARASQVGQREDLKEDLEEEEEDEESDEAASGTEQPYDERIRWALEPFESLI